MKVADYAVQVLKDEDAVARAAADIFVNLAPQSHGSRRPFRVALAGGTTLQAFYALLASAGYRNRVAWDQASFFSGDERAVPAQEADEPHAFA